MDILQEKYVAATKRILETTAVIRTGIAAIKGLRVVGDPLLCIIAFVSDEFHIYQLADEMKVILNSSQYSKSDNFTRCSTISPISKSP